MYVDTYAARVRCFLGWEGPSYVATKRIGLGCAAIAVSVSVRDVSLDTERVGRGDCDCYGERGDHQVRDIDGFEIDAATLLFNVGNIIRNWGCG